MNKNKKGFTLVEMLAAIGILLLITILTYPSFNKLNKKTEEKFDYSIKTIVENAAKIYVDNNKELIDEKITSNNSKYCLPVATLSSYDYLDTPIKKSDGENLNLKSCVYITKENEDNNIKYIYELSSDTVKDGVDYLPPIIMLKNKIPTANCTLNMYNNNVTKEDFDNLCDIKVTDDKTTDFVLGTNIIVSQVTDGDALILTYEAVDESGNKSKPLEIKLKNNIN
ncbi:prepilin-type N-terminal cleavage/methylation domain protein [Clostridium sp. CAG:433]|jgi:prepilin-type N-terminal cleavage/methylation domain-containing protein|nr:prepilin-type N-terminal cleavage/methylation domain protein [Clostridium sp. CAG:433]